MLIEEKIATRAQIEKQIEQLGFLGRDEDLVRHELKAAYHDAVLATMKAPPTQEGKLEALRRITQRLDSSDKGNLTEDWYRDVMLGGRGETHVAARQDVLAEDQDIKLEKNRYVDIVDGNMGREIKSGEGKLGGADLSQMRDYARMVDGQANLRTPSGSAQIKHVRYTFTSHAGAKANVETMRMAFTDDKLKRRISFEVFTPEGRAVLIETEKQLAAQRWLVE